MIKDHEGEEKKKKLMLCQQKSRIKPSYSFFFFGHQLGVHNLKHMWINCQDDSQESQVATFFLECARELGIIALIEGEGVRKHAKKQEVGVNFY